MGSGRNVFGAQAVRAGIQRSGASLGAPIPSHGKQVSVATCLGEGQLPGAQTLRHEPSRRAKVLAVKKARMGGRKGDVEYHLWSGGQLQQWGL